MSQVQILSRPLNGFKCAETVLIVMVDCPHPDCKESDKEFQSDVTMRQHHTKVHGERLPNSICKDCEKDFFREQGGKYCDECWSDDMTGENNPNYAGGKKETSCIECGKSFKYYPSCKKGKFCSECVEDGDVLEGPPNRHEGETKVEYDDPTGRTGGEESDVGVVSEEVFETKCVKKGLNVSKPVTYMCPYDYVVEVDSKLYKVQVKTGVVRSGSLSFSIVRRRENTNRSVSESYDNVDVFVVRNKHNDNLYWISNEEIDVEKNKRLRLEEPGNPHPNITWAHHYEFDRQIALLQ